MVISQGYFISSFHFGYNVVYYAWGDVMNICGQRIRLIREAANLTQEQLGKKIGSTGVTIMRYEKGSREPRQNQLQKIADVLDISICFFQAAAPFEDLDFLNQYKAVIIHSLEEHHCFKRGDRTLFEIGDYEYWKILSKNIASVVKSGSSTLSIQYKYADMIETDNIKFTTMQIEVDFNKPIQVLVDNGYAVPACQVLFGLSRLNSDGIAKVLERIEELTEIPKYQTGK